MDTNGIRREATPSTRICQDHREPKQHGRGRVPLCGFGCLALPVAAAPSFLEDKPWNVKSMI